jgi:hypothetical protein
MKSVKCNLIPLRENVWFVKDEPNIDLIYSEDDGGYYFEYGFEGGTDTSKVYPTLFLAVDDYKHHRETIFN